MALGRRSPSLLPSQPRRLPCPDFSLLFYESAILPRPPLEPRSHGQHRSIGVDSCDQSNALCFPDRSSRRRQSKSSRAGRGRTTPSEVADGTYSYRESGRRSSAGLLLLLPSQHRISVPLPRGSQRRAKMQLSRSAALLLSGCCCLSRRSENDRLSDLSTSMTEREEA